MTTSKSTEVDLTVFVLYFIKIEKTKNSSKKKKLDNNVNNSSTKFVISYATIRIYRHFVILKIN